MLNGPPLTANNAGQWAIPNAPPDTDAKWEDNFSVDQALKTKPTHRWFEIFDIGTESRTGSNQVSYASPLAQGGIMRVHTDSVPDYWMISMLVNTAGAQLRIWLDADPSGPSVRIGNGGSCILPAKGKPFLCVQAIAQSVVGSIIAVGGYDAQTLWINGGNQP